jgi:hypothetical protein
VDLGGAQASGTLAAGREPAHTGDVTNSAGSLVLALNNIPDLTTQAGSILHTNIAAPTTPAGGKTKVFVDSTSKNIAAKNDAGAVNHGIQSRTATASNWIRSIADDGTTGISQPAFTDISGAATTAQAGVPTGGTTGQTLSKNSATNYDASWATPAGADLVYDGDYPTGGPSYTDGDIVIQNQIAYMCVRPTSSAPTVWPGGTGVGTGLPTGGTANQILSKNSGTDYDAIWITDLSTTTLQTALCNPAGTTTFNPGVMCGISTAGGGAATITPVRSGKIVIIIPGYGSNNTINNSGACIIRYGTGTAPVNGAAATGTIVGAESSWLVAVASQRMPFSVCAVVTGLTLGTTYWIDLGLRAITGGTASVTGLAVTAYELP